jgi:hypothetical protein
VNQREGFLRRLRVTTICILCGDEDELLVMELRELPAMPLRCSRCRGHSVAAEWNVLWLPDPSVRFDWDAGAPRRGRPPKHPLVSRRTLEHRARPAPPHARAPAELAVPLREAKQVGQPRCGDRMRTPGEVLPALGMSWLLRRSPSVRPLGRA